VSATREVADVMHSDASTAASVPAEAQGSAPTCEGCAKPFLRKRLWQRFCSTTCRNEWHRKDRMGPTDRIAELERRVKTLEEQVELVRGHLVV